MNLYLFNDNDSAATFGIGTYIKELSDVLENSDIRVHIVNLHSIHPEFEIIESDKVENWYIPEVRNDNTFSGNIQKVENYYRNLIYLLQLFIRDKNNLVFHFNFNQCQALAKGLKDVFECKTVATVHFLKWAFELHGNLSQLHTIKTTPENQRSKYEQLLYTTDEYEKNLFREVDHVIALSKHMRNFLCDEYQLYPKKISIIPNGLKDVSVKRLNNRDLLRKNWYLSEKEFLILFVGRLHSIKGLTFLIRAFRKTLEKIPDCRLIIAGSGNYDTYFKEAYGIYPKVTFTGLLRKKELIELYQIADIGVIPSLYEPFGYVAIEMMMHGLPIIATATSGLNEVVDDACGIKIPIIKCDENTEIDTNLLAEKIENLLQQPDEAKQYKKNARKKYEEQFSSEVYGENMIDFYNNLISF